MSRVYVDVTSDAYDDPYILMNENGTKYEHYDPNHIGDCGVQTFETILDCVKFCHRNGLFLFRAQSLAMLVTNEDQIKTTRVDYIDGSSETLLVYAIDRLEDGFIRFTAIFDYEIMIPDRQIKKLTIGKHPAEDYND